MTIALGILASDGLLIAADMQETYTGLFKMEQGKICGCFNEKGKGLRNPGALVMSGAGSSHHIDALTQQIAERFSRDRPTSWEYGEALKEQVHDFGVQHIVPFVSWPEYDRPSVSLLAATQIGGKRRLYATDKTVVHQCQHYAAIGIGAPHANVLMARYWRYGVTLEFAKFLATYVLFHVKRHVDGCGNHTQMVTIRDGMAYALEPERIDLWEAQCEAYADLEDRMFHYAALAPKSLRDAERIREQLNRIRERVSEANDAEIIVKPKNMKRAPTARWVHDDHPSVNEIKRLAKRSQAGPRGRKRPTRTLPDQPRSPE